MIDSTDLCIRYDNFLEIAEDHLVPTKSGYYDNFLTDERKLSWRRVPYSNLLRGTKWSSVGSERQHQRMARLSPSTMSGAEWSQVANGTLMPLEWALYVVWANELRSSVFSLQSGDDQPLTSACQLTAKDHLEEVRPAQALGFVEV